MGLIKNFVKNEDGNYAVMFAVAILPIVGAVAVAADYSNLSRLNYNLSDAVDSMCTVVAREFMDGKTSDVAKLAGDNFFRTNIDTEYKTSATATFVLPDDPGNTAKTLRCKGQIAYKPMFGPLMAMLTGGNENDYVVLLNEATMRMKNVAEISLVLDNSGSMAYNKSGQSGAPIAQQRITLLKDASKKLVSDMITLGARIQQASDPVRFSIVPFAGAVNVGATNANASWMDTRGISPIHHENLDWGLPSPSNPTGFRSVAADGAKLDASGIPLTRFSILDALKFRTGGTAVTTQCQVWNENPSSSTSSCRVFNRSNTTEVLVNSTAASSATGISVNNLNAKYRWSGCVEARPNGLDVTDAAATGTAAFVPFFGPDELNLSQYNSSSAMIAGNNNWWPDYETDTDLRNNAHWSHSDSGQLISSNAGNSSWQSGTARPREVNVAKYFVNKPFTSGTGPSSSLNRTAQSAYFTGEPGPNDGCRTTPITPLTSSITTLHSAINAMSATNSTNIPEGLAWGWRSISSREPFSQGVSETRKDIDKVVIVLTDGANTYSNYDTVGNGGDMAANKTNNFAYGRTGYAGNGGTNGTSSPSSTTNITRLFQNTTANKTDHSDSNFQKAMDEKMLALCGNIKNEDIILMTVALDMDPANYPSAERPAIVKAIQTMSTCAGDSRSKKNTNGTPKKLFWNAKSDNLDETFKEIADELSNLRFTQ
ncbi:MAG: hypothetical protein ACRCU5_00870 [Rhizobiaceae bacterium]